MQFSYSWSNSTNMQLKARREISVFVVQYRYITNLYSKFWIYKYMIKL